MSFDQTPGNPAFSHNVKKGVREQVEQRILKRCKISSIHRMTEPLNHQSSADVFSLSPWTPVGRSVHLPASPLFTGTSPGPFPELLSSSGYLTSTSCSMLPNFAGPPHNPSISLSWEEPFLVTSVLPSFQFTWTLLSFP